MDRTRRLILLAATVVALVVAFVALRPSSEDSGEAGGTAAAPVSAELKAGSVEAVTATKGQMIKLTATSERADELHVHGYDLMRELPPGEPVTLSFPATITGVFEVEFEQAGTQVAKLTVEP